MWPCDHTLNPQDSPIADLATILTLAESAALKGRLPPHLMQEIYKGVAKCATHVNAVPGFSYPLHAQYVQRALTAANQGAWQLVIGHLVHGH